MNEKFLQNILTCIVITLVLSAIVLLNSNRQPRNPILDLTDSIDADTVIIKTVAHIDFSSRYATPIYKDYTADIAYYYINSKYIPATIGDTVQFVNGATGTVVGTDVNGFAVELPVSYDVFSSMSGTGVYLDTRQVGFVSSKTDNLVYCIWY